MDTKTQREIRTLIKVIQGSLNQLTAILEHETNLKPDDWKEEK